MNQAKSKVNVDLQSEREKCTFNVTELTHFIDGGSEETGKRRSAENLVINEKGLLDDVPEEYLSHKEKYSNAVRKACLLAKTLKSKPSEEKTGLDNYRQVVINGRVGFAVLRDGSPFMLHTNMFVPTILGQGTPEQQAKWIPRAWDMRIIGTYAQTELGHGTFIRGLETTATYDPTTKEFILNSPAVTSYKWWPGGMGHTANYCLVVAQLHTKGKSYGIHPFIVQLRDEETHIPLPGIKVGEIGAKMGFNTVNNGFLGFKNVRIPRDQMLMKNSQVLEDGTYITAPNTKLAYGTMIFIRVIIVCDASFFLAKAATIAVRYSAVRRQSQPKPNEPEPQILDYVTQQYKLFVALASSYSFLLTSNWLWNMYSKVVSELERGESQNLQELHALACCLKAVATADASAGVERCRLACGGHGYMQSSNLPLTYGLSSAACTYEGENTVLLLQTARYLVKVWGQASRGASLPPTVAYLATRHSATPWENSVPGIIRGFQIVAAKKVETCVANIERRKKTGLSYEDAWNLTSVQLVAASEAHARSIILAAYYAETQKATLALSPALAQVLQQLVELYSVYWALERVGDLLQFTSISQRDVEVLQLRLEDLLGQVRPNAVGLVDAFDIRDELLQSTLGAYDGRVYERLMQEAMRSPLNAKPVDDSFHKYLKPFMQGKL